MLHLMTGAQNDKHHHTPILHRAGRKKNAQVLLQIYFLFLLFEREETHTQGASIHPIFRLKTYTL